MPSLHLIEDGKTSPNSTDVLVDSKPDQVTVLTTAALWPSTYGKNTFSVSKGPPHLYTNTSLNH